MSDHLFSLLSVQLDSAARRFEYTVGLIEGRTTSTTLSSSSFPPFSLQDIESENINVVKRLFRIQNINASTIRTVMVAHCRRHDNPDLLLDYEAQSQARRQKGAHQHQPLLFDLGTSGSEEEMELEEEEEEGQSHSLSSARLPHPTISSLDHVFHVSCFLNSSFWLYILKTSVIFHYVFLCLFVLHPFRVVKMWGPGSWRLRPTWLR